MLADGRTKHMKEFKYYSIFFSQFSIKMASFYNDLLLLRKNVVDRDLHLYFQGRKISANHIKCNIWKTAWLAKNAQVGLLW